MQRTMKKNFRIYERVLFCLLLPGITGCVSSKISSPPQTTVEQLLLSTATDRAVSGIKFDAVQGKKVFLDTQYADCYRVQYVIGALREALDTAGVLLTEKREDAEIVMELRSPVLSIDENETMIGIPSISSGIPGGPSLPEGPLYKKTKQDALATLSVYSFDRNHKNPAVSLGSSTGRAYYYRWRLLFIISFRTTDLKDK